MSRRDPQARWPYPLPHWPNWLTRDRWRLDQAIVLALGIDPDTVLPGYLQVRLPGRVANAAPLPPEFRHRLEIAKSCIGESLPARWFSALDDRGGGYHVRLAAFAHWALGKGWKLPPEFRDVGSGATPQPRRQWEQPPGPKGGEESIGKIAWEIAEAILTDDQRRPKRGYGRLIALARQVNQELAGRGIKRQDESVRKAIGRSLREWESKNSDK